MILYTVYCTVATVQVYSVYTSWLHSMETREVVSLLKALVMRRMSKLSLYLIYLSLEFWYDFNSCMKMRVSVSWCTLLSIATADVLGRWFDVFIITCLKVRVKLRSWYVQIKNIHGLNLFYMFNVLLYIIVNMSLMSRPACATGLVW